MRLLRKSHKRQFDVVTLLRRKQNLCADKPLNIAKVTAASRTTFYSFQKRKASSSSTTAFSYICNSPLMQLRCYKYLCTSYAIQAAIKKLYQKFLDNLELVGKDSIDKTKIKALSTLLELLAGNPEQESLLLGKIVNKLG